MNAGTKFEYTNHKTSKQFTAPKKLKSFGLQMLKFFTVRVGQVTHNYNIELTLIVFI